MAIRRQRHPYREQRFSIDHSYVRVQSPHQGQGL